jgi:ATP-dependent Clp protease ATP-binding subunit ClpA
MSAVKESVEKFFKPELRNRIDHIVLFESLKKENIKSIVVKILNEVTEKIKTKHKIKLVFNDDVINWLIDNGYDNKMGARPIKRLIETKVILPVAESIVNGKVKRNHTITFNVENNNIVI